jgi:hypothetical protein
MSRRKRKSGGARPAAQSAVTPERFRRGDLELVPHQIADEAGRPARPYRAVDTLSAMLRKGTITPAMHQAADDFRLVFTAASLDPLRALDPTRLPQGLAELPLSLRQIEARRKVWRALQALGGIASPAGACVWHVVGCQATLKEWALRQGWGGRPLTQEAASGVLVGALGVLQAHYGL